MPEENAQPTATTTRIPSPVRLQDELLQVLVDQWGHRGEFMRGMILRRSEIDTAEYDVESALARNVVRKLTEAEARSLPLTTALDENGETDLDHARAMQFHAGVTDVPRTVTTASGPAEPDHLSKDPQWPEDQQALRPVVVVGTAGEAESEGARAARVVATPAGAVFESPEERAAREAGAAAVGQPDLSTPAGYVDGTVDEVTARLDRVQSPAALDEIGVAERAGKDRAGVHAAIERRRAAIQEAGTGGASDEG